jgi:hypothetical protein
MLHFDRTHSSLVLTTTRPVLSATTSDTLSLPKTRCRICGNGNQMLVAAREGTVLRKWEDDGGNVHGIHYPRLIIFGCCQTSYYYNDTIITMLRSFERLFSLFLWEPILVLWWCCIPLNQGCNYPKKPDRLKVSMVISNFNEFLADQNFASPESMRRSVNL